MHLFKGCKQGFWLHNFLEHKKTYVKPGLPFNAYAGKASYIKTENPHPELLKLLHKKRDEICKEKKVSVYLVANRITLDELAMFLPQTYIELSQINGFGPKRARQYGDAFLSIISQYCKENNFHSNIESIPQKRKKRKDN